MWEKRNTAASSPLTKQGCVLVVEDNTDQWVFIQLAFRKSAPAVELVLATTVQQATLYLEECERAGGDYPLLILLDLYTPWRDDSLLLLEAIRRKTTPLSQTPIIMLTASDDQEDITAAFANGSNAYVVKPSSFSAWLDCIHDVNGQWLSRKRRP